MTGWKRAFTRQRAVCLLSIAAIFYLLVGCVTTDVAGCKAKQFLGILWNTFLFGCDF